MSAGIASNGYAGRVRNPVADTGEIYGTAKKEVQQSVFREQLHPEEEAISLPAKSDRSTGPISTLTRFLGASFTTACPAWTGDPVPSMRGLQKKLVEHSLTLPEGDRAECLAAISVVEKALTWRLRLQQMRMSEVEMEVEPGKVKTP